MATYVSAGAVSTAIQGFPTFVGRTVHACEAMSESGTSSQSSSAISKQDGFGQSTYAWRVTAKGADVYVVVGDNPTASASNGVIVAVGATEWFAATPGEKVAIITVS